MRLKILLFTLLAICLSVPLGLNAQSTDPVLDIDNLFGYTEIIYSALIIVGGYLSTKIPFLNKISNGAWRVLAFAIITGIGFIAYGTPVLSLAVTYFFSTSLYEIILKPTVGPSKKPTIELEAV